MKFSNLTITVAIVGDGRNDMVQLMPISPTQFATTSPPGALSQNSPAACTSVTLVPGDNKVVGVGDIQTLYVNRGYTPGYVIVKPPDPSTNVKVVKGANTDTGWQMANNIPLMFALPPNVANWGLFIHSVGTETVDLIVV